MALTGVLIAAQFPRYHAIHWNTYKSIIIITVDFQHIFKLRPTQAFVFSQDVLLQTFSLLKNFGGGQGKLFKSCEIQSPCSDI